MPLLIACMLAGLSGALAVLGWEPFGWWPLALASYAALFRLVQNTPKASHASLIGLAFGIGLHLTGHGWIYAALHAKAGLGVIPAGLSTLLFLAYLAAFTAVPCWLSKALLYHKHPLRTPQSRFASVILYAGFLTLGEWGRSLFFNGFTSLSLGYCLTDSWLAGYAPIAGLYGTSWVGLCIAGLLPLLATTCRVTRSAGGAGILLFALSGWMLNQMQWTQPAGSPLSYRLIQANVTQEHKFDPHYLGRQVQRLVELIEQAPADIIATPETAFPLFLNELPGDILPRLRKFAQRTGSHVFAGMATAAANADGYNSVLEIAPGQDSGEIAQYSKVRLMPFGEYSPAGFDWFTRLLNIPLKDMTAGDINQPPFIVATRSETQRLGTLICHEDLVGQDARRWAASANLLLNPSNLAWFEGSSAIEQRLQIVRMRALEMGRPILRIANTGVTAHIDARGKVVSQLPITQENVLFGKVQPTTGLTPYAYVGDGLTVSLSIMSVLLAMGWIHLPWRKRTGQS